MFRTVLPTSSAQLRIDIDCPSPGAVRFAVVGEVDLSTAGLLRTKLLSVFSALRPRRIEVDLAGVNFLDCSGLTVLIVAREAAAGTGCQLRITNPQSIVRRVLDLSGVLGGFTAAFDLAPLAATDSVATASVGILVAA